MTNRLKIGQEVLIHGYVDEIRKDTIIIQNEGGYFGTVECEVTDIEMPDTNEVLDKIRAEATSLKISYTDHDKDTYRRGVNDVVRIIDRYISGKERE